MSELGTVLTADFARTTNRQLAQRVTLVVFRSGQEIRRAGAGPIVSTLWRVIDLIYLRGVLGAELPPTASVGPGLALPHAGRGVSISEDAVIGANSMIFPWVTIGRDGGRSPRLGDNVLVGTGARILGPVTVGAGAHIGANSVVIRDVPAGATAFGVPARMIRGDASPS